MAIEIKKEKIHFCQLCDKTNLRRGFHIISDDYSLNIKMCEKHFYELKETINSIK